MQTAQEDQTCRVFFFFIVVLFCFILFWFCFGLVLFCFVLLFFSKNQEIKPNHCFVYPRPIPAPPSFLEIYYSCEIINVYIHKYLTHRAPEMEKQCQMAAFKSPTTINGPHNLGLFSWPPAYVHQVLSISLKLLNVSILKKIILLLFSSIVSLSDPFTPVLKCQLFFLEFESINMFSQKGQNFCLWANAKCVKNPA